MASSRRTLLLVTPPALHAGGWWGASVPMKPHLYSLAGAVRDLAEVRLLELDLPGSGGLSALGAHLDAGVGLVGISAWTSLHYLGALEVARRVRALDPTVPIVVGGHHPTALPSDFLGEVDWIVRGDGEHVLRDLCRSWPQRPVEAEIIEGRPFGLADPWSVDWADYGDPDDDVLWVNLSRGCPYGCAFCVEPHQGRRWSAYPVEQCLGVLEALAETHAPRVVCFSDALFGANRAWTEALLAGIEARALPMMFWAQTRADLMTPTLLEALRRCQFKVDFGLDSGSAAVVAAMDKGRDPETYLARSWEVLREASGLGLHHDVYLLFNHPGETPDTTRETMDFVEALADGLAPAGWVSAQSFFTLPGTRAWRDREALAARYGTELRHPGWWREAAPHHALATDVLPSAAWRGREGELRAFEAWQADLNLAWWRRYPPEVHAFRQSFHGG